MALLPLSALAAFLCAGAGVAATADDVDIDVIPKPPTPPCVNPLNPDYETICYSTLVTSGNVSVRLVGAGVDAAVINGFSDPTDFPTGSVESAAEVIAYFESYNDAFQKLPLTAPLIFRPAPTGTWIGSMALSTSTFPNPASAPGFVPTSDLLQESFGNRTIAAYLFYTIQLATQTDYAAACKSLATALPALGYTPVAGSPWAEAWVTYSTESIVGDRINECWMEVQEKRTTP
jgi:hypothetical protein